MRSIHPALTYTHSHAGYTRTHTYNILCTRMAIIYKNRLSVSWEEVLLAHRTRRRVSPATGPRLLRTIPIHA